VARVGAPVPGLLDATFADFFRGSQLNEGGDLAFWGRVSEDGGPAEETIFFRTADGAFEVVVQAGWTLDLAPGVSKTIAGVEVDFTKRFLSDDRRIAFHAEFTDGTSGILVAIVPEPSAALLLSAAAALGLHVAREQRRAGRDG
jgi:hypothetical protein